MVTYRHKILLSNLRNKLRKEDLESVKMIGLFVIVFLMISFFMIRILDTMTQRMEAERRTQVITAQVEQLEKENKLLQNQKDAAVSDSEVEAQYRALGYKKPGEQIYIVSGGEPTSTPTTSPTSNPQPEDNMQNWQKWFIKLFQ